MGSPDHKHPPAQGPDAHFAHRHGDSAHHHRRTTRPSSALAWSLALVAAFGVVEAAVGWVSGSLALLSDAFHMLTDALALGLALGAQQLARRAPQGNQSFGYERAEPLAAFLNSIFYFVLLGFIVFEAVQRLMHPEPIRADWALPVAVVGLVVNALIWRILHGQRHQLNTRAALLHVIGDFAGSLVAIVALTAAWFTSWTWLDPLLALCISVFMMVSAWHILRESASVLMNDAPPGLDVQAVGKALRAVSGVLHVHDLHVWSINHHEAALAAHVEVATIEDWPATLHSAREMLSHRFHVHHVTLQPEYRTP